MANSIRLGRGQPCLRGVGPPHQLKRNQFMDRFHPGARTAVSRRQRSFSRLAIGVAGAIMAVGLVLIGAAVNRLDLFETLGAETFAVAAGFALVLLGVIAIAA